MLKPQHCTWYEIKNKTEQNQKTPKSAFTVFSSDCIPFNNLIDGLGWGWGGARGAGPSIKSPLDGQTPSDPREEGPGGG